MTGRAAGWRADAPRQIAESMILHALHHGVAHPNPAFVAGVTGLDAAEVEALIEEMTGVPA